MQLIRGTTPTITCRIKQEIDLHNIVQVWIYIAQQNKVKVDKTVSDVVFDYENRTVAVTLSQEDTLALKEGEAKIQIRGLMQDDTALGMIAKTIDIKQIYKQGIITTEETDNG